MFHWCILYWILNRTSTCFRMNVPIRIFQTPRHAESLSIYGWCKYVIYIEFQTELLLVSIDIKTYWALISATCCQRPLPIFSSTLFTFHNFRLFVYYAPLNHRVNDDVKCPYNAISIIPFPCFSPLGQISSEVPKSARSWKRISIAACNAPSENNGIYLPIRQLGMIGFGWEGRGSRFVYRVHLLARRTARELHGPAQSICPRARRQCWPFGLHQRATVNHKMEFCVQINDVCS